MVALALTLLSSAKGDDVDSQAFEQGIGHKRLAVKRGHQGIGKDFGKEGREKRGENDQSLDDHREEVEPSGPLH